MGKRETENNQKREKAMQLSFKKRKACIMKKTMELSVLCDLQACVVIVDSNGEVTTWPDTHSEVMEVLDKYAGWCNDFADHGEEKEAIPNEILNYDPLEWDDSVFEDLLKEPWEEVLNAGVEGDDQRLLEEVDSKLRDLMGRIEFLKSAGGYGSSQNIPYLLGYAPVDSVFKMVPTTPVSSDIQSGIGSLQTPSFFEYPTNQQNISSITCPFDQVKSEVETMPTPCFFQYAPNQQNILDMASAATGPYEIKSEVENMQTPLFFQYISNQQSILDMAAAATGPAGVENMQTPCFFQCVSNQQSILDMASAAAGPSEVENMQTPCFFQCVSNQQSILDMASAATGPSEVETIQNPYFFNHISDQQSIVDMTSTPGFFNGVPVVEVAEQGFPAMVPHFAGDNSQSQQMMFHMVPELGYSGVISGQQFDTQLNSMNRNWNYDFFSLNGY